MAMNPLATEEEIVSSDIIGSHFGSIYDATQAGDCGGRRRTAGENRRHGTITNTALSPS